MAALPLQAYLFRFMTEEERAAVAAAEADGGREFRFIGMPPDPEHEARLARQGRAERAYAAALARALATRPVATAVDTQLAQRVPFALEVLRGREHEVDDWPAGGRWDRFEAIEVEVDAGEAPLRQATGRDIDACIEALDRARLPGAPRLTRADIRKLALPWLEAHGLTAKKQAIEARFQTDAHDHRRGTHGTRYRR